MILAIQDTKVQSCLSSGKENILSKGLTLRPTDLKERSKIFVFSHTLIFPQELYANWGGSLLCGESRKYSVLQRGDDFENCLFTNTVGATADEPLKLLRYTDMRACQHKHTQTQIYTSKHTHSVFHEPGSPLFVCETSGVHP